MKSLFKNRWGKTENCVELWKVNERSAFEISWKKTKQKEKRMCKQSIYLSLNEPGISNWSGKIRTKPKQKKVKFSINLFNWEFT